MILIILFILLIYILKIKFNNKSKSSKRLVPIGYKLFYTDQKTISKKNNVIYSKNLVSTKYNISGKPDYIFKKGNKLIPIELKSKKIKNKNNPHLGDLLQLASYFIIIEEVYKIKPKYGKIVYSDYSFKIKNTKFLKEMVLNKINEMLEMLETGEGIPNCSFVNCKNCICNLTVCKYSKNN